MPADILILQLQFFSIFYLSQYLPFPQNAATILLLYCSSAICTNDAVIWMTKEYKETYYGK